MVKNIIEHTNYYIYVVIAIIITCWIFLSFYYSKNKNNIDDKNNMIEHFIRDVTYVDKKTQEQEYKNKSVQELSINNDYGESLNTNFTQDNPLNIHIPRQLFYRDVKKKHNVAFKLKMNYIENFINNVFASLISNICTVEMIPTKYNNTHELLKKTKNNDVDLTMIEEDIFDSLDTHNLYFVSGLYYKSFTFVVKEEKSITNLSDLEEKTIFGVLKNSYDAIRIIYITKILDIRLGGIIFYSDFDSMKQDFIDNKFDVMFLTVCHPDKNLIDLSKKTKFVFLNFDYNLKPLLYKHSKIPFKHKIKSNSYGFLTLDGNVYTFAIREIIVANASANKWSIYSFLNLLVNNINYIDEQTNYLYSEQLSIENMCFLQKNLVYHRGAYNYWTDKGLIIRKLANQSINITDVDT